MTETQSILYAIVALVLIREGYQQRDRVKPNKAISDIWHIAGFIMRFLLFGLIYRTGANVYILIVSVLVLWPIYNIVCAVGSLKKWYYVSKNGIDLIIRKVFYFINFDK